jgi:short-subunit dehydrogenase
MHGVRIRDAVVVITGASSGIGKAAALKLARGGAAVVLAARSATQLESLASQCEALGGSALAVTVDVTDEGQVRHLASRAQETFGRIDVWVNNAAVTLFGRLEEAPYDACRRVIETNLLGCVHGARAAMSVFREQGRGVLVNVSSVAGKVGQPYTSLYCTTKFGIVGLSESLRMETRDAPGIHVCTVLPASIDTPLFQHGANFTGRAPKPMDPVYDVERVADAIVELAQHPKREVYVGGAGAVLSFLRRLAPRLLEKKMAQQVEQEHFQDRPAEDSSGNLFEPMPDWNATRGGWGVPKANGVSAGKTVWRVAVLGVLAGLGYAAVKELQAGGASV